MGTKTRSWFVAAILGLAMVLSLLACNAGGDGADVGLIGGQTPKRSEGVGCVACLTDGVVATDGDHWKVEAAALFRSPRSVVEYDLGAIKPIRAAWLQGDNNDVYRLEVSNDGKHYKKLWDARPVNRAGLRARTNTRLTGQGRYVRVSARGGDGNYSLTELQLFSEVPSALPHEVHVDKGISLSIQVRGKLLAFGLALLGLLFLSFRRAPRWWLALVALIPVTVGVDLAVSLIDSWPQEQREVSLVRGVVAVVAGAAIFREVWAPARFPAHRGVTLGVLGLCGVVGFLAFYNLGHPQFMDHQLNRPTYVHHLDLRQYYPTAKYFDEMGYRAMYEADVAATIEDDPSVTLEKIADRPMRSLRTLQMSTVGEERDLITRAPQLFSKERWQQYKEDARYFREAMGSRTYYNTYYDMGGNATPVWISIAHLMFSQFPASNSAFQWTGLFDPLMILAAFACVGWCFGLRTAFLCMVIFGANDFIMYGSNWGGATLRHDWMAYLAFGACALKRERWILAGVLLTLATSIRAFPALALLALAAPVAWWLYGTVRERGKLPSVREIFAAQRPVFLVAASAAITGIVLFGISSALLGVEAWGDWYVKVSQLSADPHGNHISLRSLLAGWDGNQSKVLADRWPLYTFSSLFFVAMILVASRGQRYEQASVLGLILTPVLFYPANYYIHLVWLLPLVLVEPKDKLQSFDKPHAWVALLLLGMCAAQYFTVLETDRGIHFYMASVLLFATVTFMLCVLVRRNAMAAIAGVAVSAEADMAVPSQSQAPDAQAPASDSDGRHAAQ